MHDFHKALKGLPSSRSCLESRVLGKTDEFQNLDHTPMHKVTGTGYVILFTNMSSNQTAAVTISVGRLGFTGKCICYELVLFARFVRNLSSAQKQLNHIVIQLFELNEHLTS